MKEHNNKSPILISSSIQASKDNDYGKSKKEGEEYLLNHGKKMNSKVYIYRLANLFGKWCRPNYNSVTATWCYN
ncbi:capsular biosynthesis protein, partial [Thomasclavelia cocleata]